MFFGPQKFVQLQDRRSSESFWGFPTFQGSPEFRQTRTRTNLARRAPSCYGGKNNHHDCRIMFENLCAQAGLSLERLKTLGTLLRSRTHWEAHSLLATHFSVAMV